MGVCMHMYVHVPMYACLRACLSVCLSVCLSACQSVRLCAYAALAYTALLKHEKPWALCRSQDALA